jgi:hypothetical protein
MVNIPVRRPLSLAAQAFALKDVFADASSLVRRGELRWHGQLQPTWASRIYDVALDYSIGRIARVRVVRPNLTEGLGRPLPHVYIGGYFDGALCLHLQQDWGHHMPLVNTIIPWTIEWLFFYEVWRFTDTWCGTGEWPPRRQFDEPAV